MIANGTLVDGKGKEPNSGKSNIVEPQVRLSEKVLVDADAPEVGLTKASNAKPSEPKLDTFQTKFLELEYNTLRKEIETSRERTFKIIVGGLFVVPAAQYLAQAFNVGIFKLLLPLLVIIVYILYVAESHAIYRCGCYIRERIEPTVRRSDNYEPGRIEGWETWLDRRQDRAHEKQLKLAFVVLCGLFYVAATLIAATVPLSHDPLLSPLLKSIEMLSGFPAHPVGWSLAIVGFYLLIGLAAAIVLKITETNFEMEK